MAESIVRSYLGSCTEYYAVAGVVAVSYVALKICFSLLKAFSVYFLGRLSGAGGYLRSHGSWAVVTGATDGIGKEYALQLASFGINIVLISRTESKLQDVAAEIESKHKVQTKIIAADFSQGTSIYAGIKAKLQGLDIGVLVNNVGMSFDYPEYFMDVPDRDNVFMKLIHVNCTSATLMTSMVLPLMVQKKKGMVINIASAAGTSPTPLLSVYSACKVYVQYLSECLNLEYGEKGIKVQCVNPYFVCSNMSKIRHPNLFIPSARDYVRSALNTVTVSSVTNGYWPHALMAVGINMLPKHLVHSISFKSLMGANKRAKKKLAAKKD